MERKNQCEKMEQTYIQGTCTEMCPEKERIFRTNNQLLHQFEKNETIVKQFRRCAAGQSDQKAQELRPSNVLLMTMNHLVEKVIASDHTSWVTIYDFVNDRIQAIRQDLVIQEIRDSNSLQILEKATRFYIISQYILCEEPIGVFDPYLNEQQLLICLKQVLCYYKDNDAKNEDEFLSYYALIKIGSTEVLQYLLLSKEQRSKSENLEKVIKMNVNYMHGNFVSFFKILKTLPSMHQLCLYLHIPSIHYSALNVINTAFSCNNCKFPVRVLSQWLNVKESKAILLCKEYGIKIDNNTICFSKNSFNSEIKVSKKQYSPKTIQTLHLTKLIQNGNLT